MENSMGFISIVPVIIAIVLAIATKNTVVALSVACIVGGFLTGDGIFGFTNLIYESLADVNHIWTMTMVVLFSVLVTYFEKSGAIDGFTEIANRKSIKRKGVLIISWFLGLFCFADSMSPLFVGSVMKKLSDKAKISREKLAYIADSTASPVSVIHPLSSWCPYIAGLAVGIGCLENSSIAYKTVIKAIPFNFYAILSVLFVLLNAIGVIPDFGSMKKAEKRALEEGKVLSDSAVPLTTEGSDSERIFDNPRVGINFVAPILLLVIICAVTAITMGEPAICEAAMIIVVLMSISFMVQGLKFKKLNEVFLTGVKNSVPALIVLAVAYPLNLLTSKLGAAEFISSSISSFMKPSLLPFGIFIISAILSFATGTSWGTFAIMMPISLPIAFEFAGGEVTNLVLICISAVAGGGVFGDHCSPLSDTSILSSMGSGSDHIDHIKTQLPYALFCAGLSAVIYLIYGLAC